MRSGSWPPLLVVLASCASCASCAPGTPEVPNEAHEASVAVSKPRSRREVAAAMAKLQVGTPEAEVKRLLGAPDDVRRKSDPGGIATVGTREIWGYGVAGHLGFATQGQVYVGDDGKAQYLGGDKGVPPDAALLPDEALASLLRVIARAPRLAGYSFNPRDLLDAVNALQPLGKDKALAALTEYLRVCPRLDTDAREGVFLILRALFEVPGDTGFMPRMMVGGPSPAEPGDPRQIPRFPLTIEDDVPFLLVSGYALGGVPEDPEQHLVHFQKHGILRAKPLAPTSTPWKALRAVLAATPTLRDGAATGELLLGNQLLALLDPVYHLAPDASGMRAAGPAAWKKAQAEVEKLAVRWEAARGRYVPAQ